MAGPFIFAWSEAGALPFDPDVHAVNNGEHVLSFEINHEEGDFPTLEITVVNPRVGLLGPERLVWAWLSYDKAWVPGEGHTPDIVPLFYGRLIGIPEDMFAEAITLNFIARPEDYNDQKLVVAETKKVRPYWDPIWFSPEDLADPDNVLESRPELWHVDRITLEVSTSNILAGEDGTITLSQDDVFYDSMRIGFGSAPLRKVRVTAGVSWEQKVTGMEIDLRNTIGNSITTYTGKTLIENWPKTGANLGGGWRVTEGHAERIDGTSAAVYGYFNYGTFENSHAVQVPEWAGQFFFQAGGNSYSSPPHLLVLPRMRVRPTLKIALDATRGRTEGVTFEVEADVQPILTEPGDEEVLEINMSSSEIVTPLDPPGDESSSMLPPIRDLRNSGYFNSDRGEQSLEYLLALARARLLARARAVTVEVEVPFETAIEFDLSCRKSVHLTDYRLPGGECAGKITSYRLAVDGDTGELVCGISIGCSIGEGNTVAAVEGDPTYVENGYVESGYQLVFNEYAMPIAGEITYGSINGVAPNDDGIGFYNLTAFDVVLGYQVTGTAAQQEAAMDVLGPDVQTVFERLNTQATQVVLTLRNLQGGPFETNYAVPTSLLMVPKTIDLSAGSQS